MVIMGFDLSHKMTKYCIGPFSFIKPKKKREMQCGIYSGFRLGDFKREREYFSLKIRAIRPSAVFGTRRNLFYAERAYRGYQI